MLFADWGIPVPATWAGAAAVVIIVLYRIITDHFAFRSLRDEVDELRSHVEDLDRKYQEERGAKHKSRNDVARSVMALELVRRLAADCTCGVLTPLTEIIERLFTELESVAQPMDRRWPPFDPE